MSKERTRVAKNGIKIYSYRNPASHSFYLSLYLRAGNMYEEGREGGITHFLEHVLVRNVNRLMGDSLYRELDRKGIVFNASTYSEMIQFYLSGASDNIGFASKVLAGLFSPIVLSSSDVKIERDRIKAEIREADDKTSLTAFSTGIVWEGTPLSGSILGTLGSVSRINLCGIENYRKDVFTRENLFVYLTGNFSDEALWDLVELIGEIDIPSGKIRDNNAPVPKNFGKRPPHAYVKNADFSMVRFNFDMDMSKIPIGVDDLIYDVLLEGYNSPFFVEMSEKKGMFYDLWGGVEKYRNIGSFSFSFEVRADKILESVKQTLDILSDFKSTLLDEADCMKAGYTQNGDLLLDDPRDMNFTFAYDNHILSLGYSTTEERKMAYDRITPEMIRDSARIIFAPENMVIAVKTNKRKLDADMLDKIILDYGKNWNRECYE